MHENQDNQDQQIPLIKPKKRTEKQIAHTEKMRAIRADNIIKKKKAKELHLATVYMENKEKDNVQPDVVQKIDSQPDVVQKIDTQVDNDLEEQIKLLKEKVKTRYDKKVKQRVDDDVDELEEEEVVYVKKKKKPAKKKIVYLSSSESEEEQVIPVPNRVQRNKTHVGNPNHVEACLPVGPKIVYTDYFI